MGRVSATWLPDLGERVVAECRTYTGARGGYTTSI